MSKEYFCDAHVHAYSMTDIFMCTFSTHVGMIFAVILWNEMSVVNVIFTLWSDMHACMNYFYLVCLLNKTKMQCDTLCVVVFIPSQCTKACILPGTFFIGR